MFSQKRAKKTPQEVIAGGVVRAARAGAAREEWIRIAIDELAMEPAIERAGIWLEPAAEHGDVGAVIFGGAVWERNAGSLPPEWRKISTEAPLPREVLDGTSSVEQELESTTRAPMLGPLVELQRAVWVPIVARRLLSGLILAGTREKQTLLPRAKVERLAGEIGLLLEMEEDRRLACERHEDLILWRRVQDLLQEPEGTKDLMRELAESCVGSAGKGGVGAVFALIGERTSALPVNTPATAGEVNRLVLCAQSGDAEWAHSLNQGSLETLWQQAVETRRVCGAEAERLPLARHISRVVAIPMEFDGGVNAVLVAGLPRRRSSLGILERLELRALLAAQVLERRNRIARERNETSQQSVLLESNEEPVVIVDHQGFVIGMSRRARQLAGESPEAREDAHETLRFAEVFRPREWEEVHRWVKSVFVEGAPGQEDTFVAHLKNGTALRLRCTAISDRKYCSLLLERTDVLPHAREVQEVESELQQVLEWLDEGVVVFEEDDRIRAKNERFLQILGLSAADGAAVQCLEDLIRRTASSAREPEKFAARWQAFAKGAGERMREELAMEGPVPQVIERSTRAIVGENGRRVGRVEVYREVSAQRMFQSRMMQTEKLAAIGQHVTAIVHELSNPLTTILVNAQRLVSEEADGMRATLSQNILEESERATALLRQLLVLSRESMPERRRVSLNDLVDRTMELQRLALFGSHLRLVVEKQEGLPPIEGDYSQLQQVLMNLLQNAQQAIEYSGTGGTIGVRTAFGGSRVTLEVWDDGPGISGVIQARIFDPFFTTKPPGVGTGLGLAIVRGFVRQHGGTVTLLSPPHGGARFVVELPVAPAVGTNDDGKSAALLAGESPPPADNLILEALPAGEVPRVLVLEDEPTVASLIADVLREEGMRVDVLLDGRQAVEQAETESYDLAICDMRMPGMDGQRFYQALLQRQNPLHEHVLFVTGDLVASRTQEFLERHHLTHVAKPFRMEELSGAVHGMLGKKKEKAAVKSSAKAKEA
ncbi:MAG TPA: ATP-binding protein [Candidatus Dormibacteraeota bacterium]|nr:ATP-binding protein [Candidatus Dormibacteraeota bacterium]